jgi:hypothetical protein
MLSGQYGQPPQRPMMRPPVRPKLKAPPQPKGKRIKGMQCPRCGCVMKEG